LPLSVPHLGERAKAIHNHIYFGERTGVALVACRTAGVPFLFFGQRCAPKPRTAEAHSLLIFILDFIDILFRLARSNHFRVHHLDHGGSSVLIRLDHSKHNRREHKQGS
jgi:hypothetical protein